MPWHIDYDRLEGDWAYRLHGSMTLHAAKIMARDLGDAVWQAHETALAGIINNAMPLDLHVLGPVPLEALKGQGGACGSAPRRLGPLARAGDHPTRWPGISFSVKADLV